MTSRRRPSRPVHVDLSIDTGRIDVAAADRGAASVTVLPHDPRDPLDRAAARRLSVESRGDTLNVTAGRTEPRGGSVAVRIELPPDSSVSADAIAADVRGTGRLGNCRMSVGVGDIRLERTGALSLSTTFGDVAVVRASGAVDVRIHHGRVRMRSVDDAASVTVDQGDVLVGRAGPGVRVRTGCGNVHIGHADGAADVETSRGDIRVDDAGRDSVTLRTDVGDVDLGVAAGTDPRFTLAHPGGTLFRALDLLALLAGELGPAGRPVDIEVATGAGDIVLRRAS